MTRREAAEEANLANPFLSVLVRIADMVALIGGALALIFTIGYAASGRGVGAWGPNLLIIVGLVLLDVGVRFHRRHRRLANWRRYHPNPSG